MPPGERWAAVASSVLAVGALAGVEWGLRLWGPDLPSRLPYQRLVRPVLHKRLDTWAVADPRMAHQELPEHSGLAVGVFGGSAAAGLGFSPNASIARALERHLQDTELDAHVINFGLVGASSREVRWLVDDVLDTTPLDAVIVYRGNNEYLELVAERYARSQAGALDRLRLSVAGLRLTGWAVEALGRGAVPTALPRVSGAEMEGAVTLSLGDHAAVLDRYEANLRAIAQHNATIVFMPVQTNPAWQGADLRRATPAMADGVRRVAARTGAQVTEPVELDAVQSRGIPAFYDHIHYTPAGAAALGAALHRTLGGEPKAWAVPETDPLYVDEWLALGDGEAHVLDPDLWKYSRLLQTLDARIETDPRDADALIQRGNAWFFEVDGATQARTLWTQALQTPLKAVAEANLERLDQQARSRVLQR